MLCLKKNLRQVATIQAGKKKKAKMLTGFLKAAYGLAISWEELGVSNKKHRVLLKGLPQALIRCWGGKGETPVSGSGRQEA